MIYLCLHDHFTSNSLTITTFDLDIVLKRGIAQMVASFCGPSREYSCS